MLWVRYFATRESLKTCAVGMVAGVTAIAWIDEGCPSATCNCVVSLQHSRLPLWVL